MQTLVIPSFRLATRVHVPSTTANRAMEVELQPPLASGRKVTGAAKEMQGLGSLQAAGSQCAGCALPWNRQSKGLRAVSGTKIQQELINAVALSSGLCFENFL